MNDRTFDMNTWMETYKEAFSSFGKAQQDSFKALERFARFHYAVADLLQKQADLGTELSDKLKARAEEFSAMAADVQQTVGSFATQVANRATRATRATRTVRTKKKAA